MTDDIARIMATAQRLAAQMGGRFVIIPAKLADFKRYRRHRENPNG